MPRLLFVDDEPNVLSSLTRVVAAHGLECEVETAGSAVDALLRISDGGIDIVVTDVRMPGMDGIELLTRLKGSADTQQIPVIMLTADADRSVKNIAIELGALEFVNKPADPDELIARLRNVFRLKAYQDQLAEQNRILSRQVVQAQKMEIAGLLASGAAHDLNNILSGILGNTELTMMKTSDPAVQLGLERVTEAATHAAQLVRQILQLGKRDSAVAGPLDPGHVISDSLDLLTVSIPPGVTVEWTDPRLAVRINVESTALCQVVMNLMINALHAIGEQGTLRLTLSECSLALERVAEHEGIEPGDFVRIEVADTGHGMDKEVRARIFEPFFTTKGEGKGTGIGLSVVNRIVGDYGGFIEVDSEPGKGTIFSVFFPAAGVPRIETGHVSDVTVNR